MSTRKNNAENFPSESDPRRQAPVSPASQGNDDNPVTRNISNEVEEGNENYDEEQLEDDELTEEDFAGDEEDDEEVL